jgi:nitrite reductase/ring-hydroxylating ferredoxin subunit
VVDVSNSPSFEDTAVMNFFQTSTRNLLSYEAAAGVGHHVALSIVGTERIPDSGYMRAKVAQEKLIKEGSIPYSIIHATQFFEFVKRIADEATTGNSVHLPPVLFQPMAAEDVASAVSKVAAGAPLNGTVEIAGPEKFRFDELIRKRLNELNDPREVIADPHARYFGAELSEKSLVPIGDAQLGETRFEDWLNLPTSQPPPEHAQPSATASISPAALKGNEFRVSDVPSGSAVLVGEVAVFNVGGGLCATQAKCTHRQGPLDKGKLDGSTVTCPWHGSQFNVCTGEVLRDPATDALKTYRVIVDGDIGRVEVDAAAVAKSS